MTGSSPRVRGTLLAAVPSVDAGPIIPACAGNTCMTSGLPRRSRDHPRVCGEHVRQEHDPGGQRGSSPRVRGTPFVFVRRLRAHGIIPACAGNTNPAPTRRGSSRDHPRVCGEHPMPFAASCAVVGSSPRVRGTHEWRLRNEQGNGIIPACAGNTSTRSWHRSRPRDHPRVCGEHLQAAKLVRQRLGSSPRVRGTPGVRHTPHMPFGIIPACAGNTSRRRRMTTSSRGSSPRVRGTPAC